MDLGLQSKVAIVTGPAKGIGVAITLALAREGVDLCLAGRDMDAIALVAAQARELGRKAIAVKCDVTEPDQVERAVQDTLDAFGGRIDILVNVAGGRRSPDATAWDTTPEDFDAVIALNMKGCFLTMRAVTPTMRRQRAGKIVNIGGSFGMRARALRMGYSAAKWGLRGITKTFALEMGPYNVNVNNVCPGMVDGPGFRSMCNAMARRLGISETEAIARYVDEYALKRVSTGEDVANAVLFCASDLSRQITGQDIVVDGGWVV